jgi:hypothetical protein
MIRLLQTLAVIQGKTGEYHRHNCMLAWNLISKIIL